eukprot:6575264-Prymnesium_polylepis.1
MIPLTAWRRVLSIALSSSFSSPCTQASWSCCPHPMRRCARSSRGPRTGGRQRRLGLCTSTRARRRARAPSTPPSHTRACRVPASRVSPASEPSYSAAHPSTDRGRRRQLSPEPCARQSSLVAALRAPSGSTPPPPAHRWVARRQRASWRALRRKSLPRSRPCTPARPAR